MEENRIMEEEPLLRKIIKKHMVVSGDDSEQNHVTMLNIGKNKWKHIFVGWFWGKIDFLSWTSKFLNVLKMGDILQYRSSFLFYKLHTRYIFNGGWAVPF